MNEREVIDAMNKFEEVYDKESPNIKEEYLQLSRFFQNLFISNEGWIIDTGSFQEANYELLDLVYEKVKKHSLLWKLFFMVV